MDDYVSKPFSEEQLRQLISRWAPVTAAQVGAQPTGQTAAQPTAGGSRPAPVAMPVPPPSEPVSIDGALDMEMLRRMQKTHPSLVVRLIDTYLGYAPKAIQDMIAALTSQDHAKLKITAHSLKSSSANIGAMPLSGLCRELEHRLKSSQDWDDAANKAAVVTIEHAFQAVHAALTVLKDELKAALPAPKAATA